MGDDFDEKCRDFVCRPWSPGRSGFLSSPGADETALRFSAGMKAVLSRFTKGLKPERFG